MKQVKDRITRKGVIPMPRQKIGIWGIAVVCMGLAGFLNAADEEAKTTLDNLQTAYAGASNAKIRYSAFAAKADAEGFSSVAVLFRAVADSKSIHARNFSDKLKKMAAEPTFTRETPKVKSTKENLETALESITRETETMYPAFSTQATAENDAYAAMAFDGVVAAGKEQASFIKKALDPEADWKAAAKEFAVCQVCGYTVMGPPPEKCPICIALRDKFKIIK